LPNMLRILELAIQNGIRTRVNRAFNRKSKTEVKNWLRL